MCRVQPTTYTHNKYEEKGEVSAFEHTEDIVFFFGPHLLPL